MSDKTNVVNVGEKLHANRKEPSNQKRIESGLTEMFVFGKSIIYPQRPHEAKTEAIRKGPVLIVVFQKEPARQLKRSVSIHSILIA